jgi:hypothetical protein
MHSGDHQIRLLDPVQHGVAKDGVEFVLIWQVRTAHRASVQAELPGGFDL